MSGSTFRLFVKLPRQLTLVGSQQGRLTRQTMSREDFYAWTWQVLASDGILGIHEGTLLSGEAAEQGFETDAWTLDAGEAPRERDWISSQDLEKAEFYFSSLDGAKRAAKKLESVEGLELGRIEEQKSEDWDAQWKASFLSSPFGVEVSPCWRILPPWVSSSDLPAVAQREILLRINPGAGFGTGTHETTQLCLGAMARSFEERSMKDVRALDFGSGSGILAIGAALLGAQVDAVEIDPLAIDNAMENARLNEVSSRISFSQTLAPDFAPYQCVVANILRPVLLEFAQSLVARLDSQGVLILSGLIEKDVDEVKQKYSGLLGFAPESLSLGEWRALVWKRI